VKVLFQEKSIREMEKTVRRQIIQGGDGTPGDACFIRFAREIAPLYMRTLMEEVNRETDLAIIHDAQNQLIAWLIAQKAATIADPEQRVAVVRQFCMLITIQAMEMISGQDSIDKLANVRGETIQGGTQ
jgi:hypothetical protein